jgi:hypothetical protein
MIRRVLAVLGQMRFVVDVAPRFDYARARHEVALTPDGALFRSPELALSLSARCRSRSSTAAASARGSPSGRGRRPPSCSTAPSPARPR